MGFPVYDYRTDLRNVLVTPQIRSRFLRMGPGERSEHHTHDLGHEVFLVLQGRAEFEIDGETGELGPGQMCVALADQMHSVHVVGDEPMSMYLSVTPHIQPTHTYWGEDGQRLPPRFSLSGSYDDEALSDIDFTGILDMTIKATRAVAEAAGDAAEGQTELVAELSQAIAEGDGRAAVRARDSMWEALLPVYRLVGELAAAWNEMAPRVRTAE